MPAEVKPADDDGGGAKEKADNGEELEMYFNRPFSHRKAVALSSYATAIKSMAAPASGQPIAARFLPTLNAETSCPASLQFVPLLRHLSAPPFHSARRVE